MLGPPTDRRGAVTTYLVFGRTDYAEPLRQLGTVEAPETAHDQFGEGVLELSLVPEPELVWVLREVDAGG